MALLYTNENFLVQLVLLLREMGHDVLTSHEAGRLTNVSPIPKSLNLLQNLEEFC